MTRSQRMWKETCSIYGSQFCGVFFFLSLSPFKQCVLWNCMLGIFSMICSQPVCENQLTSRRLRRQQKCIVTFSNLNKWKKSKRINEHFEQKSRKKNTSCCNHGGDWLHSPQYEMKRINDHNICRNKENEKEKISIFHQYLTFQTHKCVVMQANETKICIWNPGWAFLETKAKANERSNLYVIFSLVSN